MPYLYLSYRNWKSDSIFKKMALYVNKTDDQCKSHDLNIKKKMLKKYCSVKKTKNMDLLDIAYEELR